MKKRRLNRKRYLVKGDEATESSGAVEEPVAGADRQSIMEHVRMVTSLIEGREVSDEEIAAMLAKRSAPADDTPGASRPD